MADNVKSPELLDSTKHVILRIMTEVTFRLLIAEVARINRTPDEADLYVRDLKSKMEQFVQSVNDDHKLDDDWSAYMTDFVDNVFWGIEFKENKS